MPNDDFFTFGSAFNDYIKRIEEIRFLVVSKLSDINHTDVSEKYKKLGFNIKKYTIMAEVVVAIQKIRDAFKKLYKYVE